MSAEKNFQSESESFLFAAEALFGFLIGGFGSVYFWFVVRMNVGMGDVWSSLGSAAVKGCVEEEGSIPSRSSST